MTLPVTVVTVAYKSQAVLPGMIASVPEGVAIVVVDNGSPDPVQLSGGQLIRSPQNIGFGRGCNLGAKAADTEFVLFLNPDARLAPGCLEALIRAAQEQPEAAGWNPLFLDKSGQPEPPKRSKFAASETLPKPTALDRNLEVETLHGAALFVRRALFEEIGGFDPAIFLYHEDDDLSLRLAAHGPLMCAHEANLRHEAGTGTARSPQTARLKAYHQARSRVYARKKHGERFAWAVTFVRAALAFLSLLMLSKRKRAKTIGFFHGVMSALTDGGRFESTSPKESGDSQKP